MDRLPAYEYISASRVIHKTKCLLYSLVVTPNGSNNSYLDVYDGESSDDPPVMRIRVVSTTSLPVRFDPPLLLLRGLYLSFETNLSSVMVQSDVVGEA